MATDLTTIFGNEIKVFAQNRQADRQFSGFAGCHGMTSMLLGSRGYNIIVKGTAVGAGGSYSAARDSVVAKFASMEDYLFDEAADYEFFGETFNNVVWNRVEKIPDKNGMVYRYTAEGYVIVDFVAYGRALI